MRCHLKIIESLNTIHEPDNLTIQKKQLNFQAHAHDTPLHNSLNASSFSDSQTMMRYGEAAGPVSDA